MIPQKAAESHAGGGASGAGDAGAVEDAVSRGGVVQSADERAVGGESADFVAHFEAGERRFSDGGVLVGEDGVR